MMINSLITRAMAIKRVIVNPYLLMHCGVFKNDKQVSIDAHMIKCIRNGDNVFKYASATLKNDIDVVIEASQEHSKALIYASNELKKHPKNAMKIIEANPFTFKYFPQDIRSNELIILTAIKRSRILFFYNSSQSNKLFQDIIKNIKIDSFKNKHFVLEFRESLPRLNEDRIKKLFTETRLSNIFFFHNNDKKIMEAFLRQSVNFYSFASKDLQSEWKFFSYAISRMRYQYYWEEYTPFQDAPKKFCSSKSLAIQAAKINGKSYEFFDESLRSEEEIATLYYNFASSGQDVEKNVPQSIKKNPKFINLGIRKNLLRVDCTNQAKRLLKRGADPRVIFRHCGEFAHIITDVYVPVLNENPNLVRHLHRIKTLHCFDYSKLNSAARDLLYKRYIYLSKNNKKSPMSNEDLFQRANQLVKIKDLMGINSIS